MNMPKATQLCFFGLALILMPLVVSYFFALTDAKTVHKPLTADQHLTTTTLGGANRADLLMATTVEVEDLTSAIPPVATTYITSGADVDFNQRITGLLSHVHWLIDRASIGGGRTNTSGGVDRELFDKQIERSADNASDSIRDTRSELNDDISDLDTRLASAEADLANLSIAAASTSVMAANLTLNGHWVSGDGDDEGVFVDASGNVGVGTSTPSSRLSVVGDLYLTGALRDGLNSAGTAGMVLQSTGASTRWVATSTLGITGGGGGVTTFLALTDTPGSFTANRIMFTNSGGTTLTDSASFVFTGTNLGIGTTTPSTALSVVGDTTLDGNLTINDNVLIGGTLQAPMVVPGRVLYSTTDSYLTHSSNFTFTGTNLGLGTSTPSNRLSIVGDFYLSGALRDGANASGTSGMVLQTTGTSTRWVATSTLGFTGGGGATTFLALTDTPGSFIANRIPFTNSGATALTDSTDFVFDGTNLGIGTSTPVSKLSVIGDVSIGAGPYYSQSRPLKIYDDGNAGGARVSVIGTTGVANTPAIEFVLDGLLSRRSIVRMTNEGSSDYGLDFLTTNNGTVASKAVLTGDGNFGIGSSTPSHLLTVAGNAYIGGELYLTGALRDGLNASGTSGMVLQSTGTSTRWVATSTLGISGGSSLFTDGGAVTYLTDTADNLAIGTITAGSKLTIDGDLRVYGNINFGAETVISHYANNVLFGSYALGNNVDGYRTIAIGDLAGNSFNTGFGNVFIGNDAANNLSTSSGSVVIGDLAAGANFGGMSGGDMVIVGSRAGYSLESGGNNGVMIGAFAGENVTTGGGNILMGYRAGDNITDGYGNIVIGYEIDTPSASTFQTLNIGNLIFGTGIDGTGTTTSSGNIGIGTSTPNNRIQVVDLIQFNNDESRTQLGYQAGQNLVADAVFNTFVGYQAGFSSSTASTNAADFNTGVGYRTLYSNASGVFNTALGTNALLENTSGFSNTALGVQALYNNTTGTFNTGTGVNSLFNNTTGEANSAYGYASLFTNTTGSYNTAVGFEALFANATGTNNTAIGYESLQSNTTGTDNTATGFRSMFSNTTGSFNAAQGTNALFSNTTGSFNAAQGTNALYSNTTGDLNAAQGVNTLFSNTTGTSTTAAGSEALYSNVAGSYNSAFGTYAGYELNNATGTGANTIIGYNSGRGLVTGINNTILGANVIGLSSSLSNNIIIADGAGNQRINVNSAGNVGLGTSTPNTKLQVIGDIRVGTSSTNGCIQRFDGTALTGTCSSDEDLKTDITALSSSADSRTYLEGITSLTPVTYSWNEIAAELYKNDTSTQATGLIAQDVELVFPELVSLDDKGYRQVDFTAFTFYIIQAMKEFYADFLVLKDTVLGHDDRIEVLEDENELLKARLESIERELDIEDAPYTPPQPEGEPEPVNDEETPEVPVDSEPVAEEEAVGEETEPPAEEVEEIAEEPTPEPEAAPEETVTEEGTAEEGE